MFQAVGVVLFIVIVLRVLFSWFDNGTAPPPRRHPRRSSSTFPFINNDDV